MLNQLTKAMFAENLGTIFELQLTPAQAVELKLIELREGRSTPRQEQFALLFRGPLTTPLGQGLWHIRHDALGQFDLFLVPVDRDAEGFYYEAVFNRLLPRIPS